MGNAKPDDSTCDATLSLTPALDEVASPPVSNLVGRYQIKGVLGAGAIGMEQSCGLAKRRSAGRDTAGRRCQGPAPAK